jgi:hypothetical protein
VCNPQEVCSGTAAACPADATAPDGMFQSLVLND